MTRRFPVSGESLLQAGDVDAVIPAADLALPPGQSFPRVSGERQVVGVTRHAPGLEVALPHRRRTRRLDPDLGRRRPLVLRLAVALFQIGGVETGVAAVGGDRMKPGCGSLQPLLGLHG